MKKALFTLNIDNYAPEVTELTYPFLKEYARKIGADFREITERKFPGYAPVYEKLQIHELGREYDWCIYFDADTLVHPDLFDITNHLPQDTVLHWGADLAGNRWRYDKYFLRDGRHIGSGNWLAVASNWCLDLWKPLDDITHDDALENIFPTVTERNCGITREHLMDDYTLSRNIAKYGLKFKHFMDLQKELGHQSDCYFFHNYLLLPEQKAEQIRKRIRLWELGGEKPEMPAVMEVNVGSCI